MLARDRFSNIMTKRPFRPVKENPVRVVVLLSLFALALLFSFPAPSSAEDGELTCVTTEWKMLGANHKVCVSAFTDPRVPEVTCYISQAKTGGIKGSVGLAEDPSNFAIACVRTGPISLKASLPEKEQVFKESTNVFFKATRVTRIHDKERGVLVYLVVSRHLIDGSPFNAVAAVPLR